MESDLQRLRHSVAAGAEIDPETRDLLRLKARPDRNGLPRSPHRLSTADLPEDGFGRAKERVLVSGLGDPAGGSAGRYASQ